MINVGVIILWQSSVIHACSRITTFLSDIYLNTLFIHLSLSCNSYGLNVYFLVSSLYHINLLSFYLKPQKINKYCIHVRICTLVDVRCTGAVLCRSTGLLQPPYFLMFYVLNCHYYHYLKSMFVGSGDDLLVRWWWCEEDGWWKQWKCSYIEG